MIRACEAKDLEQMIELAYRKNNDETHYSAFCCCQKEHIREEFTENINGEHCRYIGYFEGDKLIGLLCGFIDFERNSMDCAGPFVDGDFHKLSSEMFEHLKALGPQGMKYIFYFGKKNIECTTFLKQIEAENQGDEFQLYISREGFKKLDSIVRIVELPKEYEERFSQLHDTIFPEVYISGKGILQSLGIDRQVFVALDGEEIIGYSVLQTHKDSREATAEIIGVAKPYRRRGYGRAVLNYLLEVAFQDPQIDSVNLIVDQINENALTLYTSVGFELRKVNCNYLIKT